MINQRSKMKITTLNIGRGLIAKFDVIEAMLKTEDIDDLGLLEVDLQEWDSVPKVPDYEVFQQTTRGKVRVIAYVKENLPSKQINLEVRVPAVFLEVGQVTVGLIYNDFTQDGERIAGAPRLRRLREMVGEFERVAMKTAVLSGDFNVHWMKRSEQQAFLQNWAASAGFHQMINSVTRSAFVNGQEQQSTIDLIFGRGKVVSAWTCDPGVSDHLAVTCKVARSNRYNVRSEVIKECKITMDIVNWARKNPGIFFVG